MRVTKKIKEMTGNYVSDDDEERKLVMDKSIRRNTNIDSFVYVVTVFSAIGGFLFGYDTGIISGAMVFIRDTYSLDNWWQGMVVSATILSAWIFSIIAGYITDQWGRKLSIISASIVFAIGAVFMGIAWNKYVLLFGRFVVGAGVGIASMTVPIYIAEVSPIEIRGKLVTINNCFIAGGQFIAAIVAGAFSHDGINGWRYMLGIAAIPAIIQLIGFLFMPESPRWLIRRGRYQEALQVLQKIRGPDADVDEEFELIRENCLASEREHAESGGTSVFEQISQNTDLRKALLIGCALQMFQQISGINTVMYYSATIIQMSGVYDKETAVWLSAVTALVNFTCTFIGIFLVERIGRRLLTLTSLGGVILSLLILGVGFQLGSMGSPKLNWHDPSAAKTLCSNFDSCIDCIRSSSCGYCFVDRGSLLSMNVNVNGTCLLADPNSHEKASANFDHLCTNGTVNNIVWAYEWCPSKYSWMTLAGLMLYLFFFAPGMGPMPWTINSEIYPLWARSVCFSISTSFNWFFNLLVSLTFLTLTQALTKYGAFYLYAGLTLIGWIFFMFTLPETKGTSLEGCESLFAGDSTILSSRQNSVQYVHIRGINRKPTLEEQESTDNE